MHRVLRCAERSIDSLERSRHRDRVADRQAAFVAERRRCATAERRESIAAFWILGCRVVETVRLSTLTLLTTGQPDNLTTLSRECSTSCGGYRVPHAGS